MASYQYVYVMKDLTKAFPGGREVFKGITLSFLPGVKIGVLGVNGAGKSTLLKIMAGIEKEFGGEAWAAEGATIGYLSQEPHLEPDLTVGDNVALAFADLRAALARFNAISEEFAEPMDDDKMNALLAEQAELQEKIDAEDGWELDRRIDIALDALRCPPAESAVTNLSGGERRRVALCRLLLEKPDLLLLDEPTNHLDAESVAWLEKTLRGYAGTVIVVTHDRYFLENVTNWILELERGRGYPFEGNYTSWLEQKQKRLAQEEKEESGRQRALKEEREWIGASPKARQAKNQARITRYEDMLAKSNEQVSGVAEIIIPPGPRLGGTVIEAVELRKGFGNNVLIDGLSFKLPPGGIVGVIGPNGAGKTTLFNLISGFFPPSEGSIVFAGETITAVNPAALVKRGIIRTFQITEIFLALSVHDNLRIAVETAMGLNLRPWISAATRAAVERRVAELAEIVRITPKLHRIAGELSHGDQRVVEIGIVLAKSPKLLLLDEPTAGMGDEETNHMTDLIRRLNREQGITMLFVEHDMAIVFGIADRITVLDNGHMLAEGNAEEIAADPRVQSAYLGQAA